MKKYFTHGEDAAQAGMLQTNSKAGFTLAEVLITLGIIGIVAAMTLPTLIAHMNHTKHQALLKETYSILTNVMQLALDSGKLANYSGQTNNINDMKKWYDDTILPHLKTVSVCYNEPGCWTGGNEKQLNGKDAGLGQGRTGCGTMTVSWVLNNGVAVCMDDYGIKPLYDIFGVESSSSLNLVFYIDVNGAKLPNVYGRDIFILVFDGSNDTFTTEGSSLTDEQIRKDCSLTGSGRYCATYAKRNAWRLPEF